MEELTGTFVGPACIVFRDTGHALRCAHAKNHDLLRVSLQVYSSWPAQPLLADDVHDFDPGDDDPSAPQWLEAQHRPGDPFDGALQEPPGRSQILLGSE